MFVQKLLCQFCGKQFSVVQGHLYWEHMNQHQVFTYSIFFNVGLPKEDIFLTTFYGLYMLPYASFG